MTTGRDVLPPVTPPIIHRNGTSKEQLLSELQQAHAALLNARQALIDTQPNARDYYIEQGRYEKASCEHIARLKKLDEIRAEIFALYRLTDES